ncbi:hypothetical protein [Streptomyces luteireticuli]|uniref:hypothetical protein n=1 Tax=Streptomyces luteireticuli TaxID=173858 RepID=UPI0035577786
MSVLAGDVPVGARVWAYTQRHGAVERRALRREEAAAADGSPLVRLTVEGVDGRERWDFQAGATVFLLSGDVPEGTPIVP